MGGRQGAVDQYGVAGQRLAEQMERGERFTLRAFGHRPPSVAPEVVGDGTTLDLLLAE
jgi:hypothetical protein